MTALTGERAQAARQKQNFVVVVFDGVSLGIMSFAFGVFDMAKHYGVLPDLELRVVAGEPATAVTGGGLSCYVPYDLDVIRGASLVIIPNWRDPAEPPPEPLLAALRAAHGRGARVAGLCSGAFVLAAAGLLDGRPATTHWALAGQLARMYPKAQVRADQLYIDDGDVLTAGGGAAGMDLGLHLVRGHCGAAVANRLARFMVVPPHRPGGQAQYIESPLPAPDDSDPVGETMTWALGHLDRPLPVELLARRPAPALQAGHRDRPGHLPDNLRFPVTKSRCPETGATWPDSRFPGPQPGRHHRGCQQNADPKPGVQSWKSVRSASPSRRKAWTTCGAGSTASAGPATSRAKARTTARA